MKIFSLLIFISYFCLFDCLAGNSENDSFFFSKVGYQQGLSNSAVISVFQDSAGLMWFGTYDGVNCYDGRDMDVYRSDFSTNLSNNVIYRYSSGRQQLSLDNYGGRSESFLSCPS